MNGKYSFIVVQAVGIKDLQAVLPPGSLIHIITFNKIDNLIIQIM